MSNSTRNQYFPCILLRPYLFIVCLVCFLLVVSQPASADDKEADQTSKTTLETRKATLKRDLKILQEWLLNSQKKESAITQKLVKIEKEISQLNRKIQTAQQQLKDIQKQIADNSTQIKDTNRALVQQQASLVTLLQHQHRNFHHYQTDMLLVPQEQNSLERLMLYFAFINQAQIEKIANFRANLELLESLKQKKLTYEARSTKVINTLDDQQKKLLSTKFDQVGIIEQLALERQQKKTTIQQQRDALAQIDTLLEQLTQALTSSPSPTNLGTFSEAKGKLGWPIQGKVLNQYGKVQKKYPLSEHGWLIAAEREQEVKSVYRGQIVVSDWLKGYGLVVIINHGGGYLSLYGKNQALFKSVGDLVDAGETIALSSGGEQSEQGLYFSIRKNSRPQNPKLWLTSSK